MKTWNALRQDPRAVGVACATAATGLGLMYMLAAGAPTVYLVVNALSLAMGLALIAVIRPSLATSRASGGVIAMLGGVLLATALFGVSIEGASRWIRIGGVSLQASLIVLPAMLVAFARVRGIVPSIGMMVAAGALALQPDRAMAGVLAAALAMLAVYRKERCVVGSLAVAIIAFAITAVRPDTLPAVAYVDEIFYTSFDVHPLAGFAVAGGGLLLLVPAVAGLRHGPEDRACHAVFGTAWLGVLAAAALGNYPTPLVGYGGSAILGYALSLAVLPRKAGAPVAVANPVNAAAPAHSTGPAELQLA